MMDTVRSPLPTSNRAYHEGGEVDLVKRIAFVCALASLGAAQSASAQDSSYQWVQRLGGSGTETATGSGVDELGNTYVVGTTDSYDLPAVNAAQARLGGAPLYRARMSGEQSKLYSTNQQVASLAVSACDGATVYALSGAALLVSSDAGDTWKSTPLPQTIFAVNSGTQIATTCDASGLATFVSSSAGVFRSRDLVHWDAVPIDGLYQLWPDPNVPGLIYATTSKGLERSSDNGSTWVYTPNGNTPFAITTVPGKPGLLYAPLSTYLPGASIVPAVSKDFGDTWTLLGALPGRDVYPQYVVPDPVRANVLFASGPSGLFESDDAGNTWTQLSYRGSGQSTVDYSTGAIYAAAYQGVGTTVLRTLDGFKTATQVLPQIPTLTSFVASKGTLLAAGAVANNTFAAKYSPDGQLLYSTYLGGAAYDRATAMTVAADGSVLVSGITNSADFPTTLSTYAPNFPGSYGRFLYKLGPQGNLVFSTYLSKNNDGNAATSLAIAPDGGILVAGSTGGGLDTTTGAYQTQFGGTYFPCTFFCLMPTNGYVQRFRADGSAIDFGTYLGSQSAAVYSLAAAPDGTIYAGGNGEIYRLSADGSSLLAKGTTGKQVVGIAVAPDGSVYASWQSVVARLSDALTPVSAVNWSSSPSIRVAPNGGLVVFGGVTPDLTTVDPLQGPFSPSTGFVATFGRDLSVPFSTFVGDGHLFGVAGASMLADGSITLAGATVPAYGTYWYPFTPASIGDGVADVYVAKLTPRQPPIRIDSIRNAASFAANPIAAKEVVSIAGASFGSDATVVATLESDGSAIPVTVLSRSVATLVVVMGDGAPTSGTALVHVESGGKRSNTVKMLLSAASPGVYSVDGTGTGAARVYNNDGTLNTPDNPASEGDPITIYATGGSPDIQPAAFIDGFYANGFDAKLEAADGLPGLVYKLKVYLPRPEDNPNLAGVHLHPASAIRIAIAGVSSQTSTVMYVK